MAALKEAKVAEPKIIVWHEFRIPANSETGKLAKLNPTTSRQLHRLFRATFHDGGEGLKNVDIDQLWDKIAQAIVLTQMIERYRRKHIHLVKR